MPNFDNTKYYWFNEKTIEIQYCTRRELVKRYKLDGSSVSKIVRDTNKQHKGWRRTTAKFAKLIDPQKYNSWNISEFTKEQKEYIESAWKKADEAIGKFHRRNGVYSTTTIKEAREKDNTVQ